MAERDVADLRPAFRPGCLPWRELLHGCVPWLRKETDCTICREKMNRREEVLTMACCGETYHHRCFEAWRAETTMRSKVCEGCYDLEPLPRPM